MSEKKSLTSKPRKGIYLLPNLFTTGAMFAGFYAIVAAIGGRFTAAAIAVFVAGILDGLDGRVARLTNTQSEFGVEYDSLSDLVSFGLAPALIAYTWSLSSMVSYGRLAGKLGWLAAFLYVACGALRLARFNTQAETADKRFFQGLAIPAAAGVVVSLVWVVDEMGMPGEQVWWVVFAATVVTALLMVSNFRYFSFKGWPGEKVPFVWILLLVMGFILLAMHPSRVLLVLIWGYALSGPLLTIVGFQKRRKMRRKDGRDDG